MSREKPMVAIRVLNCILQFAINGFVKVLYDLCSCGFGSGEVRVHVVDEDGQGLGSIPEVRRRGMAASALDHDACFPCVHLCAAEGLAVTIVLLEAEDSCQPLDRIGDVLVHDVRQNGVDGEGTVRYHARHCTAACTGERFSIAVKAL